MRMMRDEKGWPPKWQQWREPYAMAEPQNAEGPGPDTYLRALQDGLGNRGLLRALGAGQPLPSALRGKFEKSLNVDLSAVRIHSDGAAADQARDLDALAFSVGSDIYLDRAACNPTSTDGEHLLAHEVAHVAQAARYGSASPTTNWLSKAADPAEREADTAARAMVQGQPTRVAARPSPVARQPRPPATGESDKLRLTWPNVMIFPPGGRPYIRPPLCPLPPTGWQYNYEVVIPEHGCPRYIPKYGLRYSPFPWQPSPFNLPASPSDAAKEPNPQSKVSPSPPATETKAEDEEEKRYAYTSWLLTTMQASLEDRRGHIVEAMVQGQGADLKAGTKKSYQVVGLWRYVGDAWALGAQASAGATATKLFSDPSLSTFSLGPVAHYFEKDESGDTFDVSFYFLPLLNYDAEKKHVWLSVQAIATGSKEFTIGGQKFSVDVNLSPWLGAGGGTLTGLDFTKSASLTYGAGLTWKPGKGFNVAVEGYRVFAGGYTPDERQVSAMRNVVGLAVSKSFDSFFRFVGIYGSAAFEEVKPSGAFSTQSGSLYTGSLVVGF
jgi:hypothetical protein